MVFKGALENSGRAFLRGQRRMLVTTIIGYTLFYFLRKNLSLAMPGLAQDYGITKTSLGLFLTLHGVVYGVGKFVAGPISDRSRPRLFLMGGLLLALLANIVFGFGPVLAKLFAGGAEGAAFTTALITVLGIAWVANGFFQSMGNPPCLKLLSHWVPPNELATKLAIWNSSHSIGAGLITILCGYIMGLGALGADGVGIGMWRWCFWGPAIIAGVGLAVLMVWLPGTPEEELKVESEKLKVDAQQRVPPAANHEPRTANHEPRTTNHEPRTTNHEPRTTTFPCSTPGRLTRSSATSTVRCRGGRSASRRSAWRWRTGRGRAW